MPNRISPKPSPITSSELVKDNQQVQIAIGARLIPEYRAKEDDPYRIHSGHDVLHHLGNPLAKGPAIPLIVALDRGRSAKIDLKESGELDHWPV